MASITGKSRGTICIKVSPEETKWHPATTDSPSQCLASPVERQLFSSNILRATKRKNLIGAAWDMDLFLLSLGIRGLKYSNWLPWVMRLSLWGGHLGEALVIYSLPQELECKLVINGGMSLQIK